MDWFKIITGALLATLGYLGTQLDGQVDRQRDLNSQQSQQIAVVESNYHHLSRQLDRMERKLDEALRDESLSERKVSSLSGQVQ